MNTIKDLDLSTNTDYIKLIAIVGIVKNKKIINKNIVYNNNIDDDKRETCKPIYYVLQMYY